MWRRADRRTAKKMESAMGKYLKALTENLPAFIQESEAEEKALPDIENARVIQVSKESKTKKRVQMRNLNLYSKRFFSAGRGNCRSENRTGSPKPTTEGSGWDEI